VIERLDFPIYAFNKVIVTLFAMLTHCQMITWEECEQNLALAPKYSNESVSRDAQIVFIIVIILRGV